MHFTESTRIALVRPLGYVLHLTCVLGLFGWSAAVSPPQVRGDEAPAAARDSKAFDETWQVIHIGNARIGYNRASHGSKKENGREVVRTENETVMVIARFGQKLKVRTLVSTEETADGQLLAYRFEMNNPPSSPKITTGTIQGKQLVLTHTIGERQTTQSVPWDESQKSPGFLERSLRDKPLKPGDKRTFKSFAPELNAITEMTVKAGQFEEVELLGGRKRKLLKVGIEQSVMPGLSIDEYVDEVGEPQKVTMGLLGMNMYTVPKSVALQQLSGEEVDLGLSTLIKLVGAEEVGQARKVVFRVLAPNEDLTRIFARGASQSLEVIGNGVGDLTVQAIEPPPTGDSVNKNPGVDLPPYLKPNRYLQSDDPRVVELAIQAVGEERDPWKSALLMEQWVFKNLRRKNFSILLDSAAEVARSLSGDCTEHAVLLAGMARARGIPSRCVVGLLYVPRLSAFGGHMWTEVYVRGAWIPLDATLGRGKVSPDHIKFSDTSFADSVESAAVATFLPLVSVLGKMSITVRTIEK